MNQKVEFIESYIKIGNGDYEWNDNHGELIRCKDCEHQREYRTGSCPYYTTWGSVAPDDWFCADSKKKEDKQ